MRIHETNNMPQYTQQLKENGYLRISNFLENDFADKIYRCLVNDVDWGISSIIDDEAKVFLKTNDINQLKNINKKKIKALQKEDKFQFIYNTYMMVTAYLEKREPGHYLNRVLEWLNSRNTQQYFKHLTQNNQIIKVNAQATRYLPGHFLTQHSDIHSGEGRMYAYVIGFSKDWKADWGGLLHIQDEKGNIVNTMIPEYNSLSIFKVPRNHFVSMVMPFAQSQRLAITGWLQNK